jgi:hypothetical protein
MSTITKGSSKTDMEGVRLLLGYIPLQPRIGACTSTIHYLLLLPRTLRHRRQAAQAAAALIQRNHGARLGSSYG